MAKKIIQTPPEGVKSGIEPVTPEAKENLMIALAMDLAEQRLRDGTASAQEVVHFLKLGASTTRLEKKKNEKDIELTSAKIQTLQQAQHIEELYSDAINAMAIYSGKAKGE